MTPKEMFFHTLKIGAAIDAIFIAVVYSTGHNDSQVLANHLMAILSMIIVFLVSFYRAAGVEHRQHAEWVAQARKDIHYPLRAAFEAKVTDVDYSERRRNRIHEVV
jgi:hypothetical protein